jgi:hypothetical protein
VVADGIAKQLRGTWSRRNSRLHCVELNAEMLHGCQVEFRNGYSLWPECDVQALQWLLDFIQRSGERGALRKVALCDEDQNIVGWYIYYVKRGAVGEVVQIGGASKLSRDVLVHLFHDAQEQGVIALHGVADFKRIADFSDEGCIFTCRGGWTLAYARQRELIEVLESGNGLLSRLDGEWCLNPGG